MQRNTKIALLVFFLLIVAAFPLYILTRPDISQPGTLQIKGDAITPITLTVDQLDAYPSMTLQVTLTSSSRTEDNGVFNYTGVPLKDLLIQAQVNSNVTSIFVQAQDGYGTTLTIDEAQSQNTLIAYQKDGSSLTQIKDGGEGPLRLIIGDDQYAQRWVRGVASIEIS